MAELQDAVLRARRHPPRVVCFCFMESLRRIDGVGGVGLQGRVCWQGGCSIGMAIVSMASRVILSFLKVCAHLRMASSHELLRLPTSLLSPDTRLWVCLA